MNQKKDDASRWFDRRAKSYEGGITARWRDPVQEASLEALIQRGGLRDVRMRRLRGGAFAIVKGSN